MEKKTNIAELLKDCPKGMELDCLMYDGVTLNSVISDSDYPITITTKYGFSTRLTKYGQNVRIKEAKCVIFPKGKTTWEGFEPPCKFKDGDILTYTSNYTTTFIYRHEDNEPNFSTLFYVACNNAPSHNFLIYNKYNLIALNENCDVRLATEEEKQKLFDAIKEHGYKWNEATKTLEKLIEPKFKVGDTITNGKISIKIGYIDNEYYYEISRNIANRLFIKNQDEWELISDKFPNKFDITTLKPFDKVLVRTKTFTPAWTIDFYDGYRPNKGGSFTPFAVTGGKYFQQCIPYEENKHLLGKTDDCNDFYKTWE